MTLSRDDYGPQHRLEVGAYSFRLANDERPGGPYSSRRPPFGMERLLSQPCELRYLDAGQAMACDLFFEVPNHVRGGLLQLRAWSDLVSVPITIRD